MQDGRIVKCERIRETGTVPEQRNWTRTEKQRVWADQMLRTRKTEKQNEKYWAKDE